MAAPRIAVRGAWLTALAVVLTPLTAQALGINISGAPSTIFDGNVVDLSVTTSPSLAKSMVVSLPLGFELVAIKDGTGATVLRSDELGTSTIFDGNQLEAHR